MDQNTQQPPAPTPPPTDSGSNSTDHKPNMLTGIKESLMSSNLKMILSLGVVLIILLAIPISILTLRQQQSTRSSAAVVKLGDISNGTSLGNSGDLMQVARMTVPADKTGRVASGNIRVGGGGNSGHVYLIVYADNNGTPGNLIAQSNLGTITAGASAEWVSFTFPTPFSVTDGQKIWVGRHSDGPSSTSSSTSYRDPRFYGVGIKQGDYDGVPSKTRAFGGASVPNPFGTGTDSSIKSLSIYLTVDTSFANGLSNVYCTPAQVNSTTDCTAIAPTNIIASSVKFMIGTGTLSGSCTQLGEPSNGIQTISCTSVTTGPTTGSQKISYKIGSSTSAPIDSLATVQISAGPPTSTSTPPIPTDTPIPDIQLTPTLTSTPTNVPTIPIGTGIQPTIVTVVPGQASLDFSFTLPGIGSDSAKGQNNSPTNQNPSTQILVLPAVGDAPAADIRTIASYNSATGVFNGIGALPADFTAGTYRVKLRTDSSLYKYIPGVNANILAGAPTTLSRPVLNLGDINGDNRVDTIDYSAMIYCFPAQASTGACVPGSVIWQRADVNQDGVVNEKDLSILYRSLFIVQGD